MTPTPDDEAGRLTEKVMAGFNDICTEHLPPAAYNRMYEHVYRVLSAHMGPATPIMTMGSPPVDRGHLVLSQDVGTGFWVGDDIEVHVVGLRAADGKRPLDGMSVEISIRAPRTLRIVRDELRRRTLG